MKIFCITANLWFIAIVFGRKTGNDIQSLDYEPDIEPYETLVPTERPIFKYQKNGIKLDLKIVPSANDTVVKDDFPNFPAKDIGVCILDLSLTCVQRRFHQFFDKIRGLKEITLLGNWMKLVRTNEPVQHVTERRSYDSNNGMTDVINQDIDAFFDDFVLRINLPSIQGTKKKNQIDIMFDETGLVEGRGKSGKGGKGGGGKCKKMIMMMMMGMMSMTAMKGMMMAGMSLMISKWMLIQKLMDSKKGGGGGGGGGGPWQGGGGGGGGAPLKEIVLVTKGGGGGGGGGGGCCGGGGGGPPADSYGAPPPSSSYGAPSGGWDSGGGGGWGRSFDTYASPSNIISQMMLRPGIKEKDKSMIADSPLSTENTSHLESGRIGAGAPVYGTINSVYHQTSNTSSNLTENEMRHKSTKNTTESDTGTPTPVQSRFITLRSSYQIIPVKETHSIPGKDSVETPVYVNDWKNFELTKRWKATQQSSIRPDQEAERSGQDSSNRKYNFVKSQQPYGRSVNDGTVVFHGV